MKYVVEIIVSILLLSVTSYFFYVSIKNNTGGPSKPPDDKCETYINNLIRNQPQLHVTLWFAIPTSLILFFYIIML